VEVVRRVYDAWNAGDMTALRDLCDPDVVMHHPEGWPEPGPSVGREAVDADMEFSRVFTLRERKIIGVDIFWDHAEALEAAGLQE
jgi:hypothetical protein